MHFRLLPQRFLAILLLVSVSANVGLLWFAKQQYQAVNALRLDPLQLEVYTAQSNNNDSHAKRRIVFLGDSRALSWSAPTMEHAVFINRGIGQQTSEQIRLRFQQHVAPLQADTVVLQLCINDLKAIALFPLQRDAIVARCKRNIRDIVQQAGKSGSKVILTTVFPLGEVPLERRLFWSDAVAPAIREINQFIVTQAGEGNPNVTVLDAFTVLQGETDKIKPEYSRDLLHLNARGYEVLNQQLVPLLDSRYPTTSFVPPIHDPTSSEVHR